MNTAIQDTPDKWLLPLKWVTLLIILTGFIAFILALLAVLNGFTEFDEFIRRNILVSRSGKLTSFMASITILGSTEFLAVANLLLIVFFILRKDKWSAIRILIISTTSYAFMKGLKSMFQRARPDDPIIAALKNYSFPSGHAFMAVAFYGFLLCWAIIAIREKKKQFVVITTMILLIFIIGFSRIYLGVHYPTDVLAGWGIGAAWLVVSLLMIDKIISSRHRA